MPMPKVPLTSLPPKAIAPLNRAPVAVLLTGRAEERELMVVEPLAPTTKSRVLLEEATWKTSKVGEVEVPSTTKVALGVVEPMPTLWLAVTLRMEMPEDDETLKGSKVVLP